MRASEKHEQEAKQRIRTLHGHKGSLERAIVTLKEAEEEEDSQEDIATYVRDIGTHDPPSHMMYMFLWSHYCFCIAIHRYCVSRVLLYGCSW